MQYKNLLAASVFSLVSSLTFAAPVDVPGAPSITASGSEKISERNSGKYFDRAIFVVFENTNYSDAIQQPFFKKLADEGVHFTNFLALTHPSQGNYIALTSGDLNGVKSDRNYDIDVPNVVDLLERKGITWKVYAEDYPGNCFTGASKGLYARKHNPFISYVDIQKNPERCQKIVNATEFDQDRLAGRLPNYIFYVPNQKNDGHDTGVAFADKWYSQKFGPLIKDTTFMNSTVLISTFDESGRSAKNQIYTSIFGPVVRNGRDGNAYTIPSLLRLVEENWDLGDLGLQDRTSNPIQSIWK